MSSVSARWQELFWALPSGEMRHKLRALEIDTGRAVRDLEAENAQLRALYDQLARLLGHPILVEGTRQLTMDDRAHGFVEIPR